MCETCTLAAWAIVAVGIYVHRKAPMTEMWSGLWVGFELCTGVRRLLVGVLRSLAAAHVLSRDPAISSPGVSFLLLDEQGWWAGLKLCTSSDFGAWVRRRCLSRSCGATKWPKKSEITLEAASALQQPCRVLFKIEVASSVSWQFPCVRYSVIFILSVSLWFREHSVLSLHCRVPGKLTTATVWKAWQLLGFVLQLLWSVYRLSWASYWKSFLNTRFPGAFATKHAKIRNSLVFFRYFGKKCRKPPEI